MSTSYKKIKGIDNSLMRIDKLFKEVILHLDKTMEYEDFKKQLDDMVQQVKLEYSHLKITHIKLFPTHSSYISILFTIKFYREEFNDEYEKRMGEIARKEKKMEEARKKDAEKKEQLRLAKVEEERKLYLKLKEKYENEKT